MLSLILVACLTLSWSVTCVRINYYLQSVVLTGFVFFSQFFWALRFLFRLNDSILIKFLVFPSFFFRNAFIWINTCSPCGCFARQLVWWFPAMFCNAGPSHCFLATKWSTDANSKERIGLNFYINCWEFSCWSVIILWAQIQSILFFVFLR